MIAVEKLAFNNQIDLHRSIMEGEDPDYGACCEALARRLGEELRAAKSRPGGPAFDCGEVLLPLDLLPDAAAAILAASEREPCGLRGCTLDIVLETEDSSRVSVGCIKWDPSISSTFQLSLTLRQDTASRWTARLSHFLKTLTKGRTLVISPHFTLDKTRLYRSLSC